MASYSYIEFLVRPHESQCDAKIAPIAIVAKHSHVCWIFTSSWFISSSRNGKVAVFMRYSTAVYFWNKALIGMLPSVCATLNYMLNAQLFLWSPCVIYTKHSLSPPPRQGRFKTQSTLNRFSCSHLRSYNRFSCSHLQSYMFRARDHNPLERFWLYLA